MTSNVRNIFTTDRQTNILYDVGIIIINKGYLDPESYFNGFSMLKMLRKAYLGQSPSTWATMSYGVSPHTLSYQAFQVFYCLPGAKQSNEEVI